MEGTGKKDSSLPRKEAIDYLIDMAGRFPERSEHPDKWNRWLGFLQGAMWALGLKDIETMKQENRVDLQAALEDTRKTLKHARGK